MSSREHLCPFCYREWDCSGCDDRSDRPRPCDDCAAIFEAGRLAVFVADVAYHLPAFAEAAEWAGRTATWWNRSDREWSEKVEIVTGLDRHGRAERARAMMQAAARRANELADCRAWLARATAALDDGG